MAKTTAISLPVRFLTIGPDGKKGKPSLKSPTAPPNFIAKVTTLHVVNYSNKAYKIALKIVDENEPIKYPLVDVPVP
jgi:hypothetical protein